MQLRRRPRDERGFTLVELLVTVAILGVITVPLSDVVISGLRNTGTTSDRMDVSHDAQISSSYFARDVASVGLRDWASINGQSVPFKQSVQLDASYNSGGYTCGTAATTPVAAIRLLSDSWDPAVSMANSATDVVAYYLTAPVDGLSELRRLKCSDGTKVSDIPLAHNVKPGSVTVTCSSECQSADVPEEITVRFTATKPSVGDYPITLDGQRRQS